MSELQIQAGAASDAVGAATPKALRSGRRFSVGEILSALFLLFVIAAAIVPNMLAPTDPLAIDPVNAFAPPSFRELFGTDESGRSIYARVVHGAGSSLLIGVAATVIGLALGSVLGILAGIGGRIADFTVNRLLEVLFSLPALLLALLLIVIIGPGVIATTLAVGVSTAPGYARIIRGQLVSVRSSAYVEASTVLGVRPWKKLRRHILPNALAPLFTLATLGIGQAIIWASALSYLGLGAVPPSPEWGAMLSAGRIYLATAWWMSVAPGLFIVLTAVCATVLGRGSQRRTRER